jgi:exonuclease SbcC
MKFKTLDHFSQAEKKEEKDEEKEVNGTEKGSRDEKAKPLISTQLSAVESGFVIERIELKGFMRYLDHTTIDFPDKFTGIVGKTGAGKTTLLDAITFVLYKKTTRTDFGVKIEDLFSKNGGWVKLVFRMGKDRYEVKRGIDSSGASQLALISNGKNVSESIPELDRSLRNIVGLDYVGFRNSTFIRQDEMKQLGAERGSERLQIFQKLFRLDIFQDAQDEAKKRLDQINQELSRIEGEIDFMNRQIEDIKSIEGEIEKENQEKKRLETDLGVLSREIKEKNEKFRVMSAKYEDFLKLNERLSGLIQRKNEIRGQLEEKKKDLELVKKLKDEICSMEEELKTLRDLRELVYQQREKKQVYLGMQKELDLWKARHDELQRGKEKRIEVFEDRLRQQIARINRLKTSMDKEQAFDTLRSEGKFQERILRIDKEMDWLEDRPGILKELEKEQEKAKNGLEKILEEEKGINEDIFARTEIKRVVESIKQDINREKTEYDKKILEVENNLKNVDERISKLGFEERELKELEPKEIALRKMEEREQSLQKLKKSLESKEDPSLRISELNQESTSNENEIANLENKIKALKFSKSEYDGMTDELDRLNSRDKDLNSKIKAVEAKIEEKQHQIERIQKIGEDIKSLDEKRKNLQERRQVLTILKEEVFHNKGIVRFGLERIIPELSREASDMLSDLTAGRLNQIELEPYSEKKEYGIRIKTVGPGGDFKEIQEFSGGEKTQINAALRFAISNQLASFPQVGKRYGRMKTLFIDEGDLGSLDTEGSRELFVRKIFDMGKTFDKVILITHLTDVADQFEYKIRINMTPEPESKSVVEKK